MFPLLPQHGPHSRLVIASRIPPSHAQHDFQTGFFPCYHGNGKQICWVYFGNALWSDRYFTARLGTHDGPVWMLLGKSLVELTHHISQVHARTHCSSRGPVFQSCSPLPSVSELLGWMFSDIMGSFDWTGTVWKKSSPKCFQSQSRIKKNEKKWVRKNDHCLVSKNVNTGQVWLKKNQPLIETSVRGECSCSQRRLLMWSQLHRMFPCLTTWMSQANISKPYVDIALTFCWYLTVLYLCYCGADTQHTIAVYTYKIGRK